jgi:hypothetical protein
LQVTEELRFQPGAAVEAMLEDGWTRGTVLRTWDQGNPYLIELADGGTVWGPVDSDDFVRAA